MVCNYIGDAITNVRARKLVTKKMQRGIAAMEFALVFPVLFMLFYGIFTYCLIFVAQQSLTLAAEEGARAALRYDVTPDARGKTACIVAKQAAGWLNNITAVGCVPSIIPSCYVPAAPAAAVTCVKVTVTYPYGSHPLVPSLLGSLMTNIAIPTTLGSSATVQID